MLKAAQAVMKVNSDRLLDSVWRIEIRHAGTPASDPAQGVDRERIGFAAGEVMWQNFEQRVRQRILVVIYVRLNQDALNPVNVARLIFMECKLHVSFTELDLLVTGSCTGMEEAAPYFGRERTLGCCQLNLLDQSFI